MIIWLHQKKDKVPTLTEFNRILDTISHEDRIGHLFTAGIKFHDINEKTLLLMSFSLQFLRKIKRLTHMKDPHFNYEVLL